MRAETIMKVAHARANRAKLAALAAERLLGPRHQETMRAQDLAVQAAIAAYRSCAAVDTDD